MKKSASACLLMVSAFAVQDELFVLAAAAALSGLFAAVSLSLLRVFFRHEFRARKRVVCCQLATLVCMAVFFCVVAARICGDRHFGSAKNGAALPRKRVL